MTPDSPTSGPLSWELSAGHRAVLEAFDSQTQAAPSRFREACTSRPDDLYPLFCEAVEPLLCSFAASIERIVDAATSTDTEWHQGRLTRGVRRVHLLARQTPADFRHLVALRTDLDIEAILGPASRAFDAAYDPIHRTVLAGAEAAYALGCGLRAAVEARSLPDTLPEDW